MKHIKILLIVVISVLVGYSIWVKADDRTYLEQIFHETWDSIDYLVDKTSGMPFDNTSHQNYTSMSNIGLYLACVVGARNAGFISQENAIERITKTVDFLEKAEKWNGFPPSWIQVYHPVSMDRIVSPVDSGHVEAGLIISRQAFPILEPKITKLIQAMDWKAFYDAKKQALKGGFNLKKNEELDFRYSYLGSDLRMANFLTVATGAATIEFWNSLLKIMEERYDVQYLTPGWRAGGLFLQLMPGLFLDERYTFMGKSASNMAYAQINHAWKKNYPVWGWSACVSPDGTYLGENKLVDRVVTPHASILAINYYPQQVTLNLKALEKFRLRRPFQANEGPRNFGYRDSVDILSGKVTEKFLFIDQSMIFLSLCNFLRDGVIIKTFKQDPIIKKGMELIKDYQAPVSPELDELYKKRDLFGAQENIIPLDLGIPNPIIKPFVEPILIKTTAHHAAPVITIDGKLDEWSKAELMTYPLKQALELGIVMGPADLDAKSYLMWDEKYLYFAMEVVDDEIINVQEVKKIFKEDCVELFINPSNEGLNWGNAKDFQIGFAPASSSGAPQTYAWFQNRIPDKDEVNYSITTFKDSGKSGYRVEAAISWKFLGVDPKPGMTIGVSPAVHDVDEKKTFDTKLNWCFLPPKIRLGEVLLES